MTVLPVLIGAVPVAERAVKAFNGRFAKNGGLLAGQDVMKAAARV